MAVVWPLTALYAGPFGLWAYFAIGRKWTFLWSTIGSLIFVPIFLLVPMNNQILFWLGIPMNILILMKFPPMGPFMTELFPTAVRGTAQGFCYNASRAIGSFLPTIVGFASQSFSLGASIAVLSTFACGLTIVMLMLLPETRGRSLASLEAEPVSAGTAGVFEPRAGAS